MLVKKKKEKESNWFQIEGSDFEDENEKWNDEGKEDKDEVEANTSGMLFHIDDTPVSRDHTMLLVALMAE